MSQHSDALAANRAQTWSETDPFTLDRYAQFCRHFPAHARTVLDVGCNTGRGGQVLKQRLAALEVTGLDLVPERVAALDAAVYASGLCGSAHEIPAPNESFDVIVAGEFLEHVPPAQVDATLAEFFRVLRLRGRLLLTTPNPDYLKNKLKGLSVLGGSHVSQHYPDSLVRRLRAVGFSRVRILGSGRVSRYLGQHFPFLAIYGSYLASGDKW